MTELDRSIRGVKPLTLAPNAALVAVPVVVAAVVVVRRVPGVMIAHAVMVVVVAVLGLASHNTAKKKGEEENTE